MFYFFTFNVFRKEPVTFNG